MKKILKIALIIIIIAAVLFGAFTLIRNLKAKHHAPMISYETSYGGGMEGSYSMTKIKKLDDETAVVTSKNSDWVFRDPEVAEYIVPISFLRDIEKTFDKYRIYTFENLPDSPVHVLDAGSSGYYFGFEDYESVRFSSNQIIPKRGHEALREINEIIVDAVRNGRKLPGLVNEAITDEELLEQATGDDGKITIRVFEYSENDLSYRIHNGTEEEIKLQGSVEVYKLDGDSQILIAEDSDYSGFFNVYERHFRDEIIELDDRLDEGTYIICLDDLRSEFVIGDSSAVQP